MSWHLLTLSYLSILEKRMDRYGRNILIHLQYGRGSGKGSIKGRSQDRIVRRKWHNLLLQFQGTRLAF